jgi:heme a synthase
MNRHRVFGVVSALAFVAVYATVLLGGNVMATDSGLACPDWPNCFAHQLLPPVTGAAGIESAHRMAVLVLSILVGTLCVLALAWERRRPVVVELSLAAGGLVLLEAVLGYVVVDSGLSVTAVLLHFAVATILFALLLLVAMVANLRQMPKRWTRWVLRATEEREPPERLPAPLGRPGPEPLAALGPGAHEP